MRFILRNFVSAKDFRVYEVIKQNEEYDIDNPQGTQSTYKLPMIIYKKELKKVIATSDEMRIDNILVGKIENKYKLENNDIIILFNDKYRVIKLLPRIYSDFSEFELEKISYD